MFGRSEPRAGARRGFILVAAVMLPGALFASPAHAEVCAGTQNIFHVCVEPTGGTLVDDCVYLASDTCTPVVVPGPVITRCGNTMITCF